MTNSEIICLVLLSHSIHGIISAILYDSPAYGGFSIVLFVASLSSFLTSKFA